MSEAESWLLHLLPDKGELALDIGANEGSFTTLLAERFQEVHAFDPNPQITPTLRQRANGKVRLFEFAVYKEPATLILNLYPGPEHASAYSETVRPDERGPVASRIFVPATALDLLGYPDRYDRTINFVKIDVEGGEVDVLTGAEQTIRAHQQPQLLIEIHNLDNLHYCRKLLPDWGYQVEHIPHPHPGVHPGHCWLSAGQPAAVAAERGI